MAYSEDFRLKVMNYLDEGYTQVKACAVFNVSWATVSKWHQRYKKTGEVKDNPPRRKPRTPKLLNSAELKTYVKAHPGATLLEIGEALGCSDSTVLRGLRRLGIAYKRQLKLEYEALKTYIEAHPYSTNQEIGKVFGCTAGSASRAFTRYGFTRLRRRKGLDIEALKKYIKNHPHAKYKELTKAFGCCEPTVRAAFKRLGVKYDFVKRAWTC